MASSLRALHRRARAYRNGSVAGLCHVGGNNLWRVRDEVALKVRLHEAEGHHVEAEIAVDVANEKSLAVNVLRARHQRSFHAPIGDVPCGSRALGTGQDELGCVRQLAWDPFIPIVREADAPFADT